MEILDFKSQADFLFWLKENYLTSDGVEIFMYKKGYFDQGLSYEDAVCAALCYGWIDSVTHSYDEVKFIQHFAKRRKNSNWSISNIKRMKKLIQDDKVTEYGLLFFNTELLDQIEVLEQKEILRKEALNKISQILLDTLKKENMYDKFNQLSKSQQRQFNAYVQDAKKIETQLRRCNKIIDILNGEKNNL